MEDLIDSSWCAYPRVYALGQRAVQEIFSNDVLVEEKIDGSQFSFGKFGGELRMRSKSAIVDIYEPEKKTLADLVRYEVEGFGGTIISRQIKGVIAGVERYIEQRLKEVAK